MGVGVAFAWGSTDYTIGSAARMGPGYFPLVLGILLAALGGLITFKSLVVETADGDKIGRVAWKPLFFIIAANLVFGVCLGGLRMVVAGRTLLDVPPMGVIAGIYALTVIASLAGDEFKAKEVLLLATVLAAASYVAFILVLKLQFPVWPAFMAT